MRFNERILSRISIVVIFLALIRSLLEFFRLEYTIGTTLSIADIKLYILGALISAVSCLLMVVLSFYSKNKLIIITGVTTLAIMLILKFSYPA